MSDGFVAERSDKLFDKYEDRFLRGMSKRMPPPVFRKVKVAGTSTLMWYPCNDRALIALENMTPEARVTFLMSANTERTPPTLPESLRVLSSRPIKATPRGVSEADAFGPNVQMHAKEKPVEFQWKLAGQGVRDCAIAKRLKPTMLDHSVPRGRNVKINRLDMDSIDVDKLVEAFCAAKRENPQIKLSDFVNNLSEEDFDNLLSALRAQPTGVHHNAYNPTLELK